MEQMTKNHLETADELLSRANNELCKPEEDVVHYSVCQNAYDAIVNYLGSFLLENNVEFEKSSSVEDLLSICRSIDKRFNELNLAPLYNPNKSQDAWMSIHTANNFMAMAVNTRKMVQEA